MHACAQVAHFDTQAERPIRGWVLGANSHLPPDIAISWAMEVESPFHARHTAQGRSYRYCMLRRATRPAILRDRVCWIRSPLDVEAMHEGAQALVGEHDFTSFRAVECQSTTAMRHVDAISVRADGPLVVIEISANAYLHHMVRNIAGHAAHGRRGRAPAGLGGGDAGRPRPDARRHHGAGERAVPVAGALPEVPAGPRGRAQPPLGYDHGPFRGMT